MNSAVMIGNIIVQVAALTVAALYLRSAAWRIPAIVLSASSLGLSFMALYGADAGALLAGIFLATWVGALWLFRRMHAAPAPADLPPLGDLVMPGDWPAPPAPGQRHRGYMFRSASRRGEVQP